MTKRYVCPTCQEELSLVDVDLNSELMDGIQTHWFSVHMECMTCPEVMSVTVSVPIGDALPGNEGIHTRREVLVVDNRDSDTTWLWVSKTEYIEVNPRTLYDNMVENCFPER